MPRKVSWF
ncbi:putative lipoprotein, partial [Vibrio cholerae HC-51A1]